MRISFVVCVIVLTSAVPAFAQSATALGNRCNGPHVKAGRSYADYWAEACRGQSDCDAKLAAHNREWHSGGGGGVPPQVRRKTPLAIVMTAPAIGAGVGGLLGSVGTPNGQTDQWRNGAIGGAGAMTVVAVMANADKINPVVGAVMSTAGGAAAGNAWARYQYEQGNPDTTSRDTALGAGAGFTTWAAAKLVGAASPQWSPRVGGRTVRIDMLASPRLTGLRVRW